ncbi:MAG TPA: hypothetical protein VKA88_02020 [Solirubrobacterales bacterium]|nr:hypothetical protein [Solirubrobacterales bacterium]
MRRAALLLVAIAAIATASIAAPAATAGGKLPLLISNCAKPKFKPANVILACGDASFGATAMTWSKWTRKRAVGTGTGQINDCNPDCAHGKPKTAPVQLRLKKPVRCSNGKRVFARVNYTWTQGAPQNFPDSGSVPLGCKLLNL